MKIDKQYIEETSIDFQKSFEIVSGLKGNIVTIFGSARVKDDNVYYEDAFKLSKGLAEKGCHILTGGGPGIMEAGNRGAFDLKDFDIESIGFNISLPKEQKENKFLTKQYRFNKLFARKLMLIKYSSIFIIFPGGFGTLDELFELLVLVQSKKRENVKIFLYGTKFYQPLLDFFKNSLLEEKMINRDDLNLFEIVDSVEEIVENCHCKN